MINQNKYIIFILTSIFTSLCLGADIFVDNQLPDDCIGTYSIANRNNSGSDGDAYNTPQEAADVVNPGDTVYFREGTYYNHYQSAARYPVMNILRSGTIDNPIMFKNYSNEEAILSGVWTDGNPYKYNTIALGEAPSSQVDISGQGVQNIVIEGLIVEGASQTGLGIFGPANRYASAENPTENVIIRNVIARYNGGSAMGAICTKGKVVNCVIEYCEAYNNTGGGMTLGRVEKSWHDPEPEDDMSAAQYSVIRNCLAYNNIHPTQPGNTDGINSSHMYRCTFEDNIVFNSSDDGMDLYASIESTAKNNIIFNHNYPGGNGCGIKFSSGGGGRHTLAGNVVLNNDGYSFECSNPTIRHREYYPSRIYGNLGYNGFIGFSLGTTYNLTYPGFEKAYLRDNLALDNRNRDISNALATTTDSDYNFFSNSDDLNTMQNMGLDLNSLTGDPQLANKNVIIDTNFDPAWSIEVKLNHIRSQVKAAFSLLEGSACVDAGIIIDGYHNPNPGPGDGKVWYGNAPDIGAYDYIPTSPNWQYVLSVSSTSGGSVTNPGEGDRTYYGETVVSLQATADSTHQFVNWTGTAVDAGKVVNQNSASTTVTVDADYTIQANFAVGQPHDLTTSSTSGGTVTTPGEGAYTYGHGTAASVVATPDANYHFVNWTGTAVDAGKVANPNAASTTVTMDADYTLRANFAIDQHNLTTSSTSGGTVTTPGEGTYAYDHGTAASVVAASGANYHFVNWTGTAVDAGKVTSPNSASTIVTVDADYTIQANFSIDQHNLTTSSTSGGMVTTPGEETYAYDHGTAASVVATPEANYYFVNWTGTAVDAGKVANPNAASTSVTVDADYTVQANFGQQDGIAPTVTNRMPGVDDSQVPLNSIITLHVTDAGLGVKASSVIITLDGGTIYTGDISEHSSATGICRRTGTPADFTYAYQSSQTFDFDQLKTVTVNATDIGGIAMTEQSYSFRTEMRSFGENKKVSSGLDDLSCGAPATVRDSSGNIWVVWHAGPAGSRDIYVAKLAAGADTFNTCVQLTSNSSDQANPAIARGTDDKLYVVWQDNRQADDNNQGEWDIYVSTSVDGISWSAERRVNDPNEDNQVNPAIVIDSQSPNYAHVVWRDDRAGNQDICVAASNNSFVIKTVSQKITSDTSDQTVPSIAVDSSNTVYVLWTDARNSSNDIYGAASSGWTNVQRVTDGAADQSSPAIATESAGSILHMLWVDQTSGNSDIYYASSDGLPSSALTGSNLIDDTSAAEQLSPVIAVTGSTGNSLKVFAGWVDERDIPVSGDTDLYMVQANSNPGTNVLIGDGGTNSDQTEPAIGIDQNGYPYFVWTDNRGTNTEIYFAGSTYMQSTALYSGPITASSGGTVGNANITDVDDVSIVLPAGAWPYDVTIAITKIENPHDYGLPILNGYEFSPSGIVFNTPVTITIPYAVTGAAGTPTASWYNSRTGALSQQGITNVQVIVLTSSLHALRFKTTHLTPFYALLGAAAGGGGGGGGGGGCSISHTGDGSIVEFLLPYLGLAAVIVVLRLRDHKRRQVIGRKLQG